MIIDIESVYKDIYGLIKVLNKFVYKDEIPPKEDNIPIPSFQNGELGIYYIIDDIIPDNYKNDIALEITIVANKEYKILAQKKAIEVINTIDRLRMHGFIIRTANACMQTIEDKDGKVSIITKYYILHY